MIIFGAGWAAVFLVFTLLLRHAMRKRDELELSELEIFDTQVRANKALINIGVGLTSVLVAAIGGTNYGGLAGPVYPVLLAPGL
ncbi:MAG TPA: hypothetical protein VFV34_17965, partial [Blastocatellia bacterium]|nr:hypothetical protein [Blastocatellia bacterium]